ncbi:hypothetical protein RESH_00254 [Rhodopirellula europaea SH398]|uniref:Uncharacterized protein n=1 Tax=Rhodopirellula europaea SH398 TaxID=1263868 RepID=M5SCC1_9BACT|nr:hypothetical protein RESH_00254 [Rhodopirellula europaea SH398]
MEGVFRWPGALLATCCTCGDLHPKLTIRCDLHGPMASTAPVSVELGIDD